MRITGVSKRRKHISLLSARPSLACRRTTSANSSRCRRSISTRRTNIGLIQTTWTDLRDDLMSKKGQKRSLVRRTERQLWSGCPPSAASLKAQLRQQQPERAQLSQLFRPQEAKTPPP